MKLALYYDGECPFCSQYADMLKLKSCYDLEILDAREDLSWKKCNKDLKLDDGVLLIVDEICYQGVPALDMLLKICQYRGFFFGLHRLIFSNSLLGNGVYFIFKFLRKVALYFKNIH